MNQLTMQIRRAESYADYEGCVAIQEATWGTNTRETVPAHLLSICQKVGGLVACAIDEDGVMQGFVFGVAGYRGDTRVQWSHMLAVLPTARNRGIGRALKWFQRQTAQEDGVDVILWSFDPLVARNAHLNLNLLGAVVDRYEFDMYGTPKGDTIYAAYGTDRFVVRWELSSERVSSAASNVISIGPTKGYRVSPSDSRSQFDVEIPWDVQREVNNDLARVVAVRDQIRRLVPPRLAAGETISELIRDPMSQRCGYRFEPVAKEALHK